jgi:hypothetical protein
MHTYKAQSDSAETHLDMLCQARYENIGKMSIMTPARIAS